MTYKVLVCISIIQCSKLSAIKNFHNSSSSIWNLRCLGHWIPPRFVRWQTALHELWLTHARCVRASVPPGRAHQHWHKPSWFSKKSCPKLQNLHGWWYDVSLASKHKKQHLLGLGCSFWGVKMPLTYAGSLDFAGAAPRCLSPSIGEVSNSSWSWR